MSVSPPHVRLNRNLPLNGAAVDPPITGFTELPEKVVQFGTGAFLRGFVDAFLDQANRTGTFRGRAVAVGSTGSGRSSALNDQDGLYTLWVRGYEAGQKVDRCSIVSSLSRALSAADQWHEVLACSRNPEIALVVSNTTEVGIRLDPEDRIDLDPPRSFPGKLTAFLYERAVEFDYDASHGVTVLCCELIERNGEKLHEIVRTLGREWELGSRFLEWVSSANRFCNTLVDRIVPGHPDDPTEVEGRLGYRDDLLVEAEPYRLWAIEGDEDLRRRLEFAAADAGIVIVPDIRPYRERKVRILNGTHTIMVPLALLSGNETVYETMQHPLMSAYVRQVMLDEIVAAMDDDEARAFAGLVLERYANPYIRHALRSILLHQTMKMGVRVLPSIRDYLCRFGAPPAGIALGFAAYLLCVRDGHDFPEDGGGDVVRAMWQDVVSSDSDVLTAFVESVCAKLWEGGVDPAFCRAAGEQLSSVERNGVNYALRQFLEA